MLKTDDVDRASYLGSHDIAAIMGQHPYKSKMDVWLEKTGQKDPFEITEQMEWGLINEANIVAKWAQKIGLTMYESNVFRRHPEFEFIGGHADAVSLDGLIGMDAKNIMFKDEKWGDEGSDEVPRYTLWQGHHFLLLFPEVKTWDVVPLFTGCHHEVFTIQRDDEMCQLIIETATTFWNEHVLTKNPPDFDGSLATFAYLKKKYKHHTDELRNATPEEVQLIDYLQKLEILIKNHEGEMDQIKQELQDAIGSDKGLISELGKITWIEQKGSTRLDSKLIKAEYPEIFEQCSKTSDPLRVFRKAFTKKG